MPDTEVIGNWREGKKGDWVEADDGCIVQILKRGTIKHPHDRKNYSLNKGWLRTIVGTFLINDKTFMDADFEKHKNRYTFSSKSLEELKQQLEEREEPTKKERIFVASLLTGKSLQAAYEDAYGPKANWREHALAILKRKRIVRMINRNVEEIAEKLGLDYEYILERLMSLAESSKNDNVILGSLRELSEWLGGKEKIKQITQGEIKVFQPFTGDELASIEAERVETLDIGKE
jgi:hypothetical protein